MVTPPPPSERKFDKVELVWPGKTTEVERLSLPFQPIERVNEITRSADGQARLRDGTELPEWWPEGWRNKLIWGDNKHVLGSLLEEFTGKVDLIYIDPPFATGADFSYRVKVGDANLVKEPSAVEEVAYRDAWKNGIETYLAMIVERLHLLRDLLSPTGSLYIHCDWRLSPYLRLVLDELFGTTRFANEIAWCYALPGNFINWYPRRHDTLLFYTKSDAQEGLHVFNRDEIRVPAKYHDQGEGGWDTGWDREGLESRGKVPEDWWADISPVGRLRNELTGYPTQKPLALLRRIITASSNEGDLVLDAFAGSGTTAVAAEECGRRWIAVDLGRYAIQVSRKRLLNQPSAKPFEVLNLGRYQRRNWQGGVAGEAIWEYYRFILELYGGAQVSGFAHLHGEKEGRMVSVGPTDAPVTRAHLDAAAAECAGTGVRGLDVLGWEWEMGLNPKGRDEIASAYGIDIHLLNIPREVMDQKAVDAGDVHFFELGVASVHPHIDELEATLELDDFIPAVDDYMREKVGDAITRWSDWIDYWAVDWDYDGEVFTNSWQAYRTRKEPSLMLRSDPHQYPAPGEYQVVVKVIDIFGNDTTTELTVAVEA